MVHCRQSSPVQPNSKIMQIVPPRKNPNSYNSRSQLPQQKKRTNVKMPTQSEVPFIQLLLILYESPFFLCYMFSFILMWLKTRNSSIKNPPSQFLSICATDVIYGSKHNVLQINFKCVSAVIILFFLPGSFWRLQASVIN